MTMKVRKKAPIQYALHVKGRCLAPAMYVCDNLEEVEHFMKLENIPAENWEFSELGGFVYIDNVGAFGIGQYAVKDRDSLLVFDSLEELQEEYDVVE